MLFKCYVLIIYVYHYYRSNTSRGNKKGKNTFEPSSRRRLVDESEDEEDEIEFEEGGKNLNQDSQDEDFENLQEDPENDDF